MSRKGAYFFQALAKHYGQGLSKDLLKGVPDPFGKEVEEAPVVEAPLEAFLQDPEQRISEIHYSWILPEVNSFTSFESDFALSLLPEATKKSLGRRIQFKEVAVPSFIAPLLKKKWVLRLFPKDQLPAACLPETEFSFLLRIPKNQIEKLSDYLGIFELADLLKRVVDKKQIVTLFSFLTKDEQLFLRQCMQKKELIRLKDKVLEQLLKKGMGGNEKAVRDHFHRQGLIRLGLILSKCSPEFLWHFTHRIDTGRAKIVDEYSCKTIPDPIREALKMQFYSVVDTLKIEVNQHGQ